MIMTSTFLLYHTFANMCSLFTLRRFASRVFGQKIPPASVTLDRTQTGLYAR